MSHSGVEILLVEDNANDEMLALHAFKKQKITNCVHVVRDGAEALEYIFCTGAYSNNRIENLKVILLDLKLPKVDGIEVLRQIRNDPRTRWIPVVVLTSSNEERDLVGAYQLGVNSYIVKPVDFEQFNEVAKHLGCYWLMLNRLPAVSNESSFEAERSTCKHAIGVMPLPVLILEEKSLSVAELRRTRQFAGRRSTPRAPRSRMTCDFRRHNLRTLLAGPARVSASALLPMLSLAR